MNRRSFLASLIAIPAGVAAAVKACATPTEWVPTRGPGYLDLDEVFAEMYKLKKAREAHPQQLETVWIQRSRQSFCYSMEYLDKLDEIFPMPESERRFNWHERRKKRARDNIARLQTQRALPLP